MKERADVGAQVGVGAQWTMTVPFVPTATVKLQGAVTITDNAPGSPQSIALAGQGINTGPPPQPTLTGYCFGTITGTANMCALVKDVISCPVGQVAQPTSEIGCLPPTSQSVDTSSSCQVQTFRFTSPGLTLT